MPLLFSGATNGGCHLPLNLKNLLIIVHILGLFVTVLGEHFLQAPVEEVFSCREQAYIRAMFVRKVLMLAFIGRAVYTMPGRPMPTICESNLMVLKENTNIAIMGWRCDQYVSNRAVRLMF